MTIPLRLGVLRLAVCAATIAVLLCFVPGATPARASTITVTSKVDATGGPACTLRDAITAANTNTATGGCAAGQAGVDTISFALAQCNIVPCAIVLTSPLPVVSQDLNINGAVSGALVTINGNNAVRIFELGPVAVNLSNLRLHFGSAPSGAAIQMASGGGNGTSLTVNNVFFVGNHASTNGGAIDEPKGAFNATNAHFDDNSAGGAGGAINRSGGTLTVHSSTFISNTASSGGGAIAHRGDVTLTATIAGSSFAHNVTAGGGGAILATGYSTLNVSDSVFDDNSTFNLSGAIAAGSPVNVTRSTFSNNRALGSLFDVGGGAMVVSAVPVTATFAVTISDSTLVNNFAVRNGGALAVCNGRVLLTNVTVSGNAAKESGGGISVKSAFCPGVAPEVKLNNVTITNNTADNDNDTVGDGGGVFRAAGTVGVQNSIVAGNFDTAGNAGPGTKHPDCSGTLVSQGFTLIGKSDGCSGFVDGTNGDKVGTIATPIDALFGGLADNGGPTRTHALLDGSPALNAGNPLPPGSGGFACAAADQRGMPRPLGLRCDMGAFEAGSLIGLPLVLR